MKTNHHSSPPAYDRSEEIRREAERAIRECDTAAALTDRILRQPIADRLLFIDRADAYYSELLRYQRSEALIDHFDQPEPKFGDLTCYFRTHRKEARREQSSLENMKGASGYAPELERRGSGYSEGIEHKSCKNENRPHIKPAEAVRLIAEQKKASKTAQTTTNTPIHMTFYNYGSAQVFESGSNPTINIDLSGAPEQVSLPEEEGTSTPAELAATVNNQKQPGQKADAQSAEEGGSIPDPMFRYISPFVTDEQERLRIHAVVKNIVSGAFPMAYICGQLKQLVKEQKIALNVSHEDQHNELVRLGLPADRKGFSLQNYKNYI